MGVDGPRGRAEVGRRGVAAWLAAPLRSERVDLASPRDAGEVRARIEAAAPRVGWSGWYYGDGVVRRHRGTVVELAVGHGYGDPLRPVAFVRVVPAPGGCRVTGAIRAPHHARLWYAVFGAFALVFGVGALVAAVFTVDPTPLFGVLFAAVLLAVMRLSYDDRDALRGFLADAAS